MSSLNEKYLPLVARILLGAIFFVFGLNGFLHFMPMPSMPADAQAFMGALAETGYMLPLIKATEVVAGFMLLSGRFVPLALVLLAPGIVNITLFHLFLAPGGLILAAVLVLTAVYLAWSYRDLYRPMLSGRVVPTARKPPEQRFHHDHAAAAIKG